MKQKLGFIMPRLVIATLVAGAVALIVTTVFKLLLGLTLLAGAITLISHKAARRRNQLAAQYGDEQGLDYNGEINALGNGNLWKKRVKTVKGRHAQKALSIVPIN